MEGIATVSLPELVIERRQRTIKSSTLPDRNMDSKASTLYIWSSTKSSKSEIQISDLTSKLAIAVASLVIKSDSSSQLSNSTSSNLNLQSITTTTYPRISTPTTQSILDSSPIYDTSLNPSSYTSEISRRNSNTNLHISSKLGLNPVSIIVGALGSVALTSLLGIMLLLMRKRKKRRIKSTDLHSQQRCLFSNSPYESFWLIARNHIQRRENTSRTRNLIQQLKYKLRGESANILQSDNSRQRKVEVDRRNSEFSSDSSRQYYQADYPPLNHNMQTSPKHLSKRWPSWNDEEMDHLILSGKHSRNPTAQKISMVENQLEPNKQNEFYQLLSVKVEKYESSSELKPTIISDTPSSSLKSSRYNNNHLHTSSLTTLEYGEQGLDDFTRVNPVDFITRPGMTVLKSNDKMYDVGQEIYQSMERQNRSLQFHYDHYLRNNTSFESRSSSTIAPTYDSNRDSIYSSISFTPNEHHDKRRSDPFDLDTPDLWRARVK